MTRQEKEGPVRIASPATRRKSVRDSSSRGKKKIKEHFLRGKVKPQSLLKEGGKSSLLTKRRIELARNPAMCIGGIYDDLGGRGENSAGKEVRIRNSQKNKGHHL